MDQKRLHKVVIKVKGQVNKVKRKIQKEEDIIIKTLMKMKSILCNVKIEKEIKNTNIQLIELCEKVADSKSIRDKLLHKIELSELLINEYEKYKEEEE